MPPLRPPLEPPTLDPAFVARLTTLVLAIGEALEDGIGEPEPLIAEFEALTGKRYEVSAFFYHGAMSTEEFVEIAARPRPSRLPDVTREELVEVVRRIQTTVLLTPHTVYYLTVLDVHTPHPRVSDLIFWDDLTPEEVVEAALAYQPICL